MVRGRHIFIFLLAAFMLTLACSAAYAADNTVFSASFDDASEVEPWDGGFFEDTDAARGGGSMLVYAPAGDEMYGRSSHICRYSGTAQFQAGTIYRLSMRAKNRSGFSDAERLSGIRFGDETKSVIFEFSGIPGNWTSLSQYFMVPNSGEYGFGIELKNGGLDDGFLLDELKIERIDILPESLTIIGESSLTIPYAGEISSVYRLGAYSTDGEEINILSSISTITATNLPAGVTFDSETGTVTVNEYCPDNSSFYLECSPPEFLALEPIAAEVRLTRNILKNSDFSDDDEGWEFYPAGEVIYTGSGNCLLLQTEETPLGWQATLKPDRSAVLLEGAMYVLRARAMVDADPGSSVYSRNTSVSRDGEVEINILNLPSGRWVDVTAAFTPDADGIYGITINFTVPEECTILVTDVTLSPEQPEETYLTLHAPGNISIPDSNTTFPMSAYLRDQAGEIVSSDCEVTIYPEKNGVSLTRNGILVTPDAEAGDYELRAVSNNNSSITETLNFTLSYSNIGDGGFENHRVNEWWTAAAPAVMTIEDNGGKFARIVSDDEYAIALNNSYMKLYAERPYAFRADVNGSGQTVTAFLETVDGDRLPLIQAGSDGGRIFELFQTDEDIVGRLLLYISSDSGVNIELDNIELFRANVWVTVPTLSGSMEPGSTVEAGFSFFNNLDDSADPSDCVVSWYAQSPDGDEYLGGGMSYTIPESLLGRYLYCEVTPICRITGLSGSPKMSVPVMVGGSIEFGDGDTVYPDPPKIDTELAFPTLTPAVLKPSRGQLPFSDMSEHWGGDEILALYEAGIVNGQSGESFGPDAPITRAQLAAMICRAFSAKGGAHSFTDVSAGSWYSGYVASVYALKLMDGVTDTTFGPDQPVTREELVSILVRIYETMGGAPPTSALSWFYDYREISGWASNSVSKGIAMGLINGNPNMTFGPHRNATRTEAAVMLVRLLDYIYYHAD